MPTSLSSHAYIVVTAVLWIASALQCPGIQTDDASARRLIARNHRAKPEALRWKSVLQSNEANAMYVMWQCMVKTLSVCCAALRQPCTRVENCVGRQVRFAWWR